MKKHFVSILFAILFAWIAQGQTAVGPNDVALSKITPSGQKTPQYSLANGAGTGPAGVPAKQVLNQTWLDVEVQFATRPELIDELTFDYSILLNGKLLTGTVTHVNIAKGRDHYSAVYVSPSSIDRIMGGRPFVPSSIDNIQVRVTRQGQELAVMSLKPGQIPNVPRLTGFVLNKLDTPFAPLYWDRYEAIKPVTH